MTSFNQSLISLFAIGTREISVGLLTELPENPSLSGSSLYYWGYFDRTEPNGARVAAFGLEPPVDKVDTYWPRVFRKEGAVAVVIRPVGAGWEEAELLSFRDSSFESTGKKTKFLRTIAD
jgi:hypothetical protein